MDVSTPWLDAMHIYPVKSMAGIPVTAWPVETLGLTYDRRWMVVDTAGRFVTQREVPKMCLIRVSLGPSCLELQAPGRGGIETPLAPSPLRSQRVTVWGDPCDAWLPDPEADRWLSGVLDADLRLAFLPEGGGRSIDPHFDRLGRRVGFADGFPFLLIGAASLDDLNGRLSTPVPMNRFRPSLVVRGSPPFAEDTWRRAQIGRIHFDVVKPCARCATTTTDQATAERGVEPLRTLATYRRVEGEVRFGQNLIHRGTGELAVGDPVAALEVASSPHQDAG